MFDLREIIIYLFTYLLTYLNGSVLNEIAYIMWESGNENGKIDAISTLSRPNFLRIRCTFNYILSIAYYCVLCSLVRLG